MPEPLRLRLFENYRFVLYAPFYAAHATGAYAAEGLEVELLPSPGPGQAEAALAAGEVDVVWMGPIRVMKHHDENPDSPLVEFAEVVCRDPFSLVGARAQPGVPPRRAWRGCGSPAPARCRPRGCASNRICATPGIDPALARRGSPAARMAENVAALRDGSLDVAQLFEPFVEQAVAGGGACLVCRRARAAAPATPCSSRRATGWPPTRAVPPHGAGDVPHPALGRRRTAARRWPPRSPSISRRSTAAC